MSVVWVCLCGYGGSETCWTGNYSRIGWYVNFVAQQMFPKKGVR
jgi:hypothetical protein